MNLPTRAAQRILSAAVVASVCLSLVAAAGANAERPAGQYCAVILSEEKTMAGASKVAGKACSNTSPARALAQAEGRTARNRQTAEVSANHAAAASSTLALTLWEHANYRGNRSDIYVGSGPCDGSGYKIHLNWYWGGHLSSIQGWNRCNTATLLAHGDNYGRASALPLWYVGNYYNDRVAAMRFYRH